MLRVHQSPASSIVYRGDYVKNFHPFFEEKENLFKGKENRCIASTKLNLLIIPKSDVAEVCNSGFKTNILRSNDPRVDWCLPASYDVNHKIDLFDVPIIDLAEAPRQKLRKHFLKR